MKSKLTKFSFLICAILGCVGTYITLAQTGILKFFLIAPICALLIGAIKGTSVTLKASLFSLFALIYSYVFLDGSRRIVAFAAMVGIIVFGLLFGKFIELSRNKKIYYFPSAICVILSFITAIIVFGEPITALSVKKELDGYIASTYAEDEFVIDDFEFDGQTFNYTVTAKNDKTAYGLRIAKERSGVISDEYLIHLKKSLMRENSEAITTVLRENHPNDGFTVFGKDIYITSEKLSVFDETDYSGNMQFYIYVSNEMLSSDFTELTRQYFEELLESGVKFSAITFIGGEKGQMLFELTAKYGYAANTFDKLLEKHDHFEFLVSSIDFK